MSRGQGPLAERASEFAVEMSVVETGSARRVPRRGEHDARELAPVNGREAHGTGLRARIDRQAWELARPELLTRFTDRDDLRVGCRIFELEDQVRPLRDDACAR